MKRFAFALLPLLVAAAPAHAADSCMLQPMGSLPLTLHDDGAVTVPVKLYGEEDTMALDLGAADSAVRQSVVSRLTLQTEEFPDHTAAMYRGTAVHFSVKMPEIHIGAMSGSMLRVAVLPEPAGLPQGAAGVLGSQMLSNADVEIDFRAGKLNLFSKEHCEGAVVYWSDTAAVVPFTFDEFQRMVFTMQLDGKPVSVSLKPGNTGVMRLYAAQKLFGAGALTPAGRDAQGHALYRAAFSTLSFGGITLHNPDILVVDDGVTIGCDTNDKPVACFDRSDLEIGLGQLKGLHLYFAFGEKKLYATAADAHR